MPALLLKVEAASLTLRATMPLAPLRSAFELATVAALMPFFPLELAEQLVTLALLAEIPKPPLELAEQFATVPSSEMLIPASPFSVAVTRVTTGCPPAARPVSRHPEIRRLLKWQLLPKGVRTP